MPRTLKRRSDAISRDEESPDPTPGPSNAPASRRRRSTSSVENASEANSELQSGGEGETQQTQDTRIHTLSKKLIRLALSSEYARIPIRRTDIAQKIFKESDASPRLFKQVFDLAQHQLRDVFGMQLVELPSREKTTLKDRRAQASQAATSGKSQSQSSSASKSWILISTLPAEYKTHPLIIQPTAAPSREVESSYTALYTFILSLIYLNNSSLPEAKLERYLKRVNADTYTPFGSLEKLLSRMVKEGYIEKRRDTTSGEEVVEFVPGPRGKVEVGVQGVAGLVRSVYGFGSVGINGKHRDGFTNGEMSQAGDSGTMDTEEGGGADVPRAIKVDIEDLEARLKRSLGEDAVVVGKEKSSTAAAAVEANANSDTAVNGDTMEVDEAESTTQRQRGRRTTAKTTNRRGRPTRRNNHNNSDDNDDDNDDEHDNDNEHDEDEDDD